MEGLKGLKGYWRRRDYQRLDGSGRRGKRKNRVHLGRARSRRFWRIKIKPKFRFLRFCSPKKFLIKLRDAYVKMMLGFANSVALGGGGFSYGADFDRRITGFGRPPLKEYDEKVIVEIYKSLMVQRQLMAEREGGNVGEIACAR